MSRVTLQICVKKNYIRNIFEAVVIWWKKTYFSTSKIFSNVFIHKANKYKKRRIYIFSILADQICVEKKVGGRECCHTPVSWDSLITFATGPRLLNPALTLPFTQDIFIYKLHTKMYFKYYFVVQIMWALKKYLSKNNLFALNPHKLTIRSPITKI